MSKPAKAKKTEPEDAPHIVVLKRLLDRAQAAVVNGSARTVSLVLGGNRPKDGERDGKEYRALEGAPDFEKFHAGIRRAEKQGAITAWRDEHRGDGEKLLRIASKDLDLLARHLGARTLAQRVDEAAIRLAKWIPRFPVIGEVLATWRSNKTVRKRGPEAADDLADAAHAVDALLAGADTERILRKASAEIFNELHGEKPDHSKRLEALTPWLDVLVGGELDPSGMEKEHIWAALGLRKEPLPLLLAGSGIAELDDGTRLSLPTSYLGVPVEALRAVETNARSVLSIENLASFHEAVRARGDAPILLFYTGGMPSPTWRATYRRMLACVPADVPILHWGDVDEGGFRIAAKLAETAREAGFTLRPWQMSPDDRPASTGPSKGDPSSDETLKKALARMRLWAERAGWPEISAALEQNPRRWEQESLDPRLPPA